MTTVRTISACVFALVLWCGLLAQALAQGQNGPIFKTTNFDVPLLAAPNEAVYVTIHNPKPDPAVGRGGNIEFEWKVEEGESSGGVPGLTTIAPGEARSFCLDPRTSGVLLDGAAGARRVIVGFALHVEEGEGLAPSDPSISVDLVDRRTGAARSAVIRIKRIKESPEPTP